MTQVTKTMEFSGPLYYGGDYNPEQWAPEVWLEDVRLMREAGVNLVTLGVFSWANLEIAEGVYQFEWLDEIVDLLHANGIGIDLATATASPPAWLQLLYPQIAPVTADGVNLSHGGRQAYCISSPIYKAKASALASKLAERYGKHPAIKLWHVNNEYGCHNPMCFCEVSAVAWRGWLQQKYQDLEALNFAWGTNFWSQRYHSWQEINPPRQTPMGTSPNPTMMLDWHRFGNQQILELYKSERDAIRAAGAGQPITTNFMSMKHFRYLNYFEWAKEVDFVSTDHYLISESATSHVELALEADLTRGFAGGKPWLLMEHSTGAVNWQDINFAKTDGQMIRNSISHIARGSNGAMFFQWRASIAGSEKFHSALVPHSGTQTRIWRNVVELGIKLHQLEQVSGKPTRPASVAMVFDYDSWWALSQRNLPSTEMEYPDLVHEWYEALWELGVRVDFIPAGLSAAELSKYSIVLLPNSYLLANQHEDQLLEYAKNGGSLVVSYFTGISDENDHIKLGGYGGRLVREGFGLFVEEFAPQSSTANIQLSNGLDATHWQQWATAQVPNGEDVLFENLAAEGSVAIAKRFHGEVPSWYLGTRLTAEANRKFFAEIAEEMGLSIDGGGGVEVVARGELTFTIDHNANTVHWS